MSALLSYCRHLRALSALQLAFLFPCSSSDRLIRQGKHFSPRREIPDAQTRETCGGGGSSLARNTKTIPANLSPVRGIRSMQMTLLLCAFRPAIMNANYCNAVIQSSPHRATSFLPPLPRARGQATFACTLEMYWVTCYKELTRRYISVAFNGEIRLSAIHRHRHARCTPIKRIRALIVHLRARDASIARH